MLQFSKIIKLISSQDNFIVTMIDNRLCINMYLPCALFNDGFWEKNLSTLTLTENEVSN